MRYLALATDYDNTLTANGRVSGAARAALERLRASGRRAILVTGSRLDDLLSVCDCGDLFDYIVPRTALSSTTRKAGTSRCLPSRLPSSSSRRCAGAAFNLWRWAESSSRRMRRRKRR